MKKLFLALSLITTFCGIIACFDSAVLGLLFINLGADCLILSILLDAEQ